MTFGFTCPHCGSDAEVELAIEDWGCGASWGAPAEGGIWSVSPPYARCEIGPGTDGRIVGCGHVFTDEELSQHFEQQIQQRLAEPRDPPDDY